MGLRRPELRLGSAVRRVGGRQTVGDGHAILTITDDPSADGVAMVTCAAPHGLTANTPITLTGAGAYTGDFHTQPAADVLQGFVAVPATQFILRDAGSGNPVPYAGDVAGGRWS